MKPTQNCLIDPNEQFDLLRNDHVSKAIFVSLISAHEPNVDSVLNQKEK